MPPSSKCLGCAFAHPPNSGSSMETSFTSTKRCEILRIGRLRVGRTIIVVGDELLRFRRVEEVQIGLGHFARALGIDHLVDDGDRRLCLDGERRHDDVEFVGAKLVEREEGLVLPSKQNVADAALREGGGRAARAGIEHRHVGVEILDELLVLVLVVAELLVGVSPGGEIVPARAARGLRVRRDDLDAVLGQVIPILDPFRVPFADQEDDGRGVGR